MGSPGDLMTIKAFSEATGRSQQTIYKQIGTRLASYVHEKGGQKYIERRALVEVFKIENIQPIQPERKQKSPEQNNVAHRLYATMQETIDLLREQIKVKDQQLEAKDKQIAVQQEQLTQLTVALEHTTASLQAAQALHVDTMQQQGAAELETIQDDVAEPEPLQEAPEERHKWKRPWQK